MDPEYIRDILSIKYEIKSYVIMRLSVKLKMKYEFVEDLKIPNQKSKNIIIIKKLLLLYQ